MHKKLITDTLYTLDKYPSQSSTPQKEAPQTALRETSHWISSIFSQLGLGKARVMCLKGWAPQADLFQLCKGRSGTQVQTPGQGLDTGVISLQPPQLLPHTL